MTTADSPDSTEPNPVTKQTRRRSASDKNEFKEQLIDIAREILATQGADAVTLRSIADAARISPMAIYRYFPSKGALASHLRDYILFLAHAECVLATDKHRAPYAKLTAHTEAYLDYWLTHLDHFRFVFLRPGIESDADQKRAFWAHAQAPAAMWAHMEGVLQACWKQDKVTVEDSKAVILQIIAVQAGLLHYLIVTGNSPLANTATMRAHSVQQILDLARRAPEWTRAKLPVRKAETL